MNFYQQEINLCKKGIQEEPEFTYTSCVCYIYEEQQQHKIGFKKLCKQKIRLILIEINWIEHLDFKFIRSNPGKKYFDIFVDIFVELGKNLLLNFDVKI